MVESSLCYGCEIWTTNSDTTRRLNTVEMDYLRRTTRISQLQHITNEEVRNRMKATETIVGRIELRSLRWFGHLIRMPEDRWPRRLFQWERKSEKGQDNLGMKGLGRQWNEDK